MKPILHLITNRIVYFLLLAGCLTLITACGQTGDLFLPQQPNKKASPLPAPTEIADEGNSLDVTP